MGNTRVGYGVSNGVLSRTDDGVGSFRVLARPKVSSRNGYDILEGVGAGGDGSLAALGVRKFEVIGFCPQPPETLTLQTTHDAGSSWIVSVVDFPGASNEIRWLDARRGVTLVDVYTWTEPKTSGNTCEIRGTSSTTEVLVTVDGGSSWKSRLVCAPRCLASSWTPLGRLLVGRANGEILTSDDLGRTWAERQDVVDESQSPLGLLVGLDFATEERGFALTLGHGIWRSDDAGETWSREASPYDVPGLQFGEIRALDAERAVAGGPYAFSTRDPLQGPPEAQQRMSMAPRVTFAQLIPVRWEQREGLEARTWSEGQTLVTRVVTRRR